MDHVVYMDAKAGELDRILSGEKTMLVRGAAGRKLPHGRVHPGDRLFFILNRGDGLVRATAEVLTVFNSDKLSEGENRQLLDDNRAALQLTAPEENRWAGKRYLVLIGVGQVRTLEPFKIDRSAYGNMDDWLPVGEIERVRAA
jgi:hypothetical protein